MKCDDSSPDAYVASTDGELKKLLVTVREVILRTYPDIEETIAYGMLSYPDLAHLAAQKNYVSLYVAPAALAAFRKKHKSVDCGKSCLRLKPSDTLDPCAIEELLELARDSNEGTC